jgi:hypothetical protein
VRVENAPIVEMEQLVLAAPLDARDSCTDERPELRWLEPPTQRWVEHAHAHDRATSCAGAQHLESSFYFW